MKPADSALAPPQTLADLGESAWLDRVRRLMAADACGLPLGIGDDAALLPEAAGQTVVSTDALIEGVHFRRDWISPKDLGHKALAVNLSDLAAMGARPVAAFLALGVPAATLIADLRLFFLGFRNEGRIWGCPLAGGDLVRSPQWTIAVTVIGKPFRTGKRKGKSSGVFRRDGARPGDWLYSTGRPGRSGGGLAALQEGIAAPGLIRAHRRPAPRLAEAERLARMDCVTAALDLSDGVWDDASKLSRASGVGLEIWRDALPIDPALRRLGRRLDRDPLDWVLFGGEDYELLFASRKRLNLERDWNVKESGLAPLTPIGRVVAGSGVRLLDANGKPFPVRDRTWKHF